MTALALFASTFCPVFTLGLQSQLVNNGHHAGAFINSLAIGASNLVLFKLAPDAAGVEIAAYLAGGLLGRYQNADGEYLYKAGPKIGKADGINIDAANGRSTTPAHPFGAPPPAPPRGLACRRPARPADHPHRRQHSPARRARQARLGAPAQTPEGQPERQPAHRGQAHAQPGHHTGQEKRPGQLHPAL